MRHIVKIHAVILMLLTGSTLRAQEEKVLQDIKAGQEEDAVMLNLGADLVSRYVWRGYDIGNSPAIQPNLNFSWKGLSIGAWGSYAFSKHSIQVDDSTTLDAGNYSEIDLYISYTFKWFSLMVFDYFVMNGLNANDGNRYFDWNNATTGHTLEGILTFDGTDDFPLQVTAATLFYGEDKDKDSTGVYGYGGKNNFSTYFEVAYTFDIQKIGVELKPFIGGAPSGSSWYGPYGGIINIGLTARKNIGITPAYSLPVQVSFITNPQAQNAYLVFGMTF